MRPGQNNKRMRGRPNNRKGPNPLTRTYESSGPDVKIRGTALHIGEKYLQLARDAQSSGDPVMAESYLQHAEHYFRLIAVAQQAQQQSAVGYLRQPGDAILEDLEDGDDFTGIPDRFASPPERFVAPAQPAFVPPANIASPQPNVDRPFYPAQDRQGYERPDRMPRQDRPYQDRSFQDKPYAERPYPERQFQGRDPESRGPRISRGPRDFHGEAPARSEPRIEARAEPRIPTDDIDRKGLPAFITAPVRAPTEVQDVDTSSLETLSTVLTGQPEPERDVNGFHLRPRRRRRSKAEMLLSQESGSESTGARDPVGD